MFEQSVVEARVLAARPWTLVVSLAGQSLLISTAIVLPLLHPDVLQRAAFWIPVVSPPTAYRPPAPAKVDAVRRVVERRVFHLSELVEPTKVPDEIKMIQDSPPEVSSGGGETGTGVLGGIYSTEPGSAVVRGISQTTTLAPPQAPPRAEVKETPKPVQAIQRIRIGGGVQEARLIYGPRPVYPVLARQARIQGTVHLAALIGTDGRIANLHLTDGHPLLVGAAMDAVKRWVYRPTLLNGDTVEVVTEISVTFALQ